MASLERMTGLSQLLLAARAEIADAEHYTHGRMMRDRDGKGCFANEGPRAYSLAGAVQVNCFGRDDGKVVTLASDRLWAEALAYVNAECPLVQPGGNRLWIYENQPGTTHGDMLATLDRAIAAAQKAGQ